MIRKFFPLDKNYVLEQAQLMVRPFLLEKVCQCAVTAWSQRHNPLGLTDSFSCRLSTTSSIGYDALHPFYDLLCGIYRLKYGQNQLEFLWDGSEHVETYAKSWSAAFEIWVNEFCRDETFVKAVLDLTVFMGKTDSCGLAAVRMEHFLLKQFGLRRSRTSGMVLGRAQA